MFKVILTAKCPQGVQFFKNNSGDGSLKAAHEVLTGH